MAGPTWVRRLTNGHPKMTIPSPGSQHLAVPADPISGPIPSPPPGPIRYSLQDGKPMQPLHGYGRPDYGTSLIASYGSHIMTAPRAAEHAVSVWSFR